MIVAALLLLALQTEATALVPRATGGYVQNPSGTATFTHYSGCGQPACGRAASGYSAAISQLAFGSVPGLGAGDSCGRCFALTATEDPYSPSFKGPFGKSIVVKVTDMCPAQGNEAFCGQTVSNQANQFGAPVHFDICEDTGGAAAFFPSGRGALLGTFEEVSCSEWSGSDGSPLWNGGCLSGENASFWPNTGGCGNKGSAPGFTGANVVAANPAPPPAAPPAAKPSTTSTSTQQAAKPTLKTTVSSTTAVQTTLTTSTLAKTIANLTSSTTVSTTSSASRAGQTVSRHQCSAHGHPKRDL